MIFMPIRIKHVWITIIFAALTLLSSSITASGDAGQQTEDEATTSSQTTENAGDSTAETGTDDAPRCQTVTVRKDMQADDTLDWVATYTHDGSGTWHRQSVDKNNQKQGMNPPDEVASNEMLTFSRAHYDDPGKHEVTQEWRDNPEVAIRVKVEDGLPVREELDEDKDGKPEATIERTFNDDGLRTVVKNDADADGTVDLIRRFSYKNGLRTKMVVDQNADGQPDTSTTYEYDDHRNNVRRLYDVMGDDSPDFIIGIDYDDHGRPTRRTYDTDSDDEPDRITTYTYDCHGSFNPQPRQFP
jgi:hypothetical protein